MSWLTVAWSMVAAACLTLSAVHLLLWAKQTRQPGHLLFALMAVAAGASGMTELALLHEQTISGYHRLVRWQHVPLFFLLTSMVWGVQLYFGTGRRWLAWAITGLWSCCLAINYLSPHNLVFREIVELRRVGTFGGEFFTVAQGDRNPWAYLADFTSLLIVGYLADAEVRLWRRGERRRTILIGGSFFLFILIAGIHAPLVDAGLVETPYMISFAFLSIVAATSYELVSDVVRAGHLAMEVESNERRWRTLLENVELLVVGVNPDGRINYINPCLERVTGFSSGQLIGSPVFDLIVEEERENLKKRFSRTVDGKPRRKSDWSVRCADGSSRRVAFSNVRLGGENGGFAGVLSVGEDITDRLRAEAKTRDLTGRLIRAQEAERSRVARDLHDDITQRLARLSIDAAKVERENPDTRLAASMKALREGLVRLGEDVHAISYRLHPTVLEDLGLAEALQSECERFARREGIPCRFKEKEVSARMPGPIAIEVFRIAQEALRNVTRHAHARSVEVFLRGADGGLQLVVHDDGRGFDPGAQDKTPSMGLASMRERAGLLHGELDVESSPGHGTTIVAWVPIEVEKSVPA